MFEKNLLIFNPGWDAHNQPLEEFQDVRDMERQLVERGIELQSTTEGDSRPAHCTLIDPYGNPILIDQHV